MTAWLLIWRVGGQEMRQILEQTFQGWTEVFFCISNDAFCLFLLSSRPAFIPTQFPGYSPPAEGGGIQGEHWKLLLKWLQTKNFTLKIRLILICFWFYPYKNVLIDYQRTLSYLSIVYAILYMLLCFCPLALCYWSHFSLAVRQWCACHSSCLALREGRRRQFAQHSEVGKYSF